MNDTRSRFSKGTESKELLIYLIFIIAGISLAGWILGKLDLASYSLRFIPISHSSAAVFIALGILFLVQNRSANSRTLQLLVILLALSIAIYNILIFIDFLFEFSWDVENIFINNPGIFNHVHMGRMSPISSVFLLIITVSILCLRKTGSIALKYLGGSLSLLAGLSSAVLLIGYLYNAPLLYGSAIIPVSLPSAICFFLFSFTLYRHYELKYWTFNLVKDNKVSLQLLKSFLPIVVFVVIFQGALDTVYSINHINPPLTAAFILVIVITLTVVVIIRVSGNLGHKIHQAEQELKNSEERLLQLNIDKDRFISILGHDLRSPFNAILGLSELLKEEVRHSSIDEIEGFASHIHKSAQTLYELVDDLLIWTKAQSGKIPFEPRNLNFKDICNEELEIQREIAASKNISIECTITGNIYVLADLDMLKTVLRNLVSNAIKFTNAGGTIRIKALEQAGLVSIYVSDNGIGIPPVTLSRLFDVSQNISTTGTAKETGTGLGLLLCREFVEKHGGRIWVESEIGKGSNFIFTLPKPGTMENIVFKE